MSGSMGDLCCILDSGWMLRVWMRAVGWPLFGGELRAISVMKKELVALKLPGPRSGILPFGGLLLVRIFMSLTPLKEEVRIRSNSGLPLGNVPLGD